jgi:hypothetical protein
LILWTDDDVLPDREWLAQMAAAASTNPDCSFFGGPVEPWFSQQPPQWLTENWPLIASAYATRDLGPHEFDFTPDCLPFGANLAIRADIQRQFPYHTSLGRVGASEVRGEELQLLTEMLSAGHRGRWMPKARVQHYIPPDRLQLEYLIRFFHGIGQTMCRRDALRGRSITVSDARRKRRKAVRGRVVSALRRTLPFWPSSSWLEKRLAAARDQGYSEAAWAMLKEGQMAKAA